MVEHLAKVAAIHPSAAPRTSIKMLLFRQIAHAMANVLPARELDDPVGCSAIWLPPVRDPARLGAKDRVSGALCKRSRLHIGNSRRTSAVPSHSRRQLFGDWVGLSMRALKLVEAPKGLVPLQKLSHGAEVVCKLEQGSSFVEFLDLASKC